MLKIQVSVYILACRWSTGRHITSGRIACPFSIAHTFGQNCSLVDWLITALQRIVDGVNNAAEGFLIELD
jgi:hypothetical protein